MILASETPTCDVCGNTLTEIGVIIPPATLVLAVGRGLRVVCKACARVIAEAVTLHGR
jgi:hypothetical protein